MTRESRPSNKQQQDAAAKTSTQHHAKPNLESTTASGRDTETGYFRRWWNEYQNKMKSAFQVTPLKLQIQSER